MPRRRLPRGCEKCGRESLMVQSQRFCSVQCAGRVPLPRRQECQRCRSTFAPHSTRSRFCSPSCASSSRRTRHARPCAQCSRQFIPLAASQRFCSRPCALLGRARPVRCCPNFSHDFTARSGHQRFCSPRCSGEWTRAHRVPQTRTLQGTCESCGVSFAAKDRRQRFCSRHCELEARRARNRRVCVTCGGEFGYIDSRRRFCSRACARRRLVKRGADSPHWKGGRNFSAGTNGYVRLRAPGHPRASQKNPYVLEHILVMEQVLGRYLFPNERVHHRNGQRNDNRPENLELWKMKDPPAVRASDCPCAGCLCETVKAAPTRPEESHMGTVRAATTAN